ncbi:AGE family epimerase/isomerase [Xylanimonas ulmi]|uniref:Mannose/cellobiose epimerase-like protein (N-acyl-D-glucosamine 2-epimerase family) n=1 Tax=Xylanimonas ulmi TaxID=228973 RepID=A0A4Q7M712_9MICO|nr:AGE family epimerase/isomerase [Xylanibacterium ulmi]RZS62883.1 mannose/cellobiose epimerase-like protein (N-acyl-D-glucosamine 2-epimerase family) [Xylanibacterium ulmi]
MTALSGSVAATWPSSPTHRRWLDDEARRLLAFGAAAARPAADGGAAYLDDDGRPDASRGVQTWITARTVHSFALGHLLGVPGCAPVADAALAGLTGVLRDEEHGGWFHAVASSGEPDRGAGKSAYDHAFVMLAGASATIAGRPGGPGLLAAATQTYLDKFWDEETGRPVDTWDHTFTTVDGYRGLNAMMHSVEAMLTVASAVEAGQGAAWVDRAARAVSFVVDMAAAHAGRLPEHFGPDWEPALDLNADRPGDQFKPYGATPGHGLEWARLLLHLEAMRPADRLVETAVTLFDRAVADAWAADGADGFVYTTDWSGAPVVRTRMHWVVTEGIAAAAALYARTGQDRFADWYATWWDYAERRLIDRVRGSWRHELDPDNRPAATVWPGKPDIYHALQATLVPRLPLAPMLPAALRDGSLR